MKSTGHISTPRSGIELSKGTATSYKWQNNREPLLISLLVVDFLLFLSGALAHRGIPIPLGFGTWSEPVIIPASNVEGVGALALGSALVTLLLGAAGSQRWVWSALWLCFAGTLWGIAGPSRLAAGAIIEAGTVSNDFLHSAMVLVTTLALVRLTSCRDPERMP